MTFGVYLESVAALADVAVIAGSLHGLTRASIAGIATIKQTPRIPIYFALVAMIVLSFIADDSGYMVPAIYAISTLILAAFTMLLYSGTIDSNIIASMYAIRFARIFCTLSESNIPFTAASAIINIYLMWESLPNYLQKRIISICKDGCAYQGFVFIQLSRQRKVAAADFRNPEFENAFTEQAYKAHFDPGQRNFMVYGLIRAKWRKMAGVVLVGTLVRAADHWRRLIYVGMLTAISGKDNMSAIGIVITFLIWQALGVATIFRDYANRLQRNLHQEAEALLYFKTTQLYLDADGETCNFWDILNEWKRISEVLRFILETTSGSIVAILDLWIVIKYVGLRTFIPIAVAAIHQLLKTYVSKKSKRHAKRKAGIHRGDILESFYVIHDRIRSIKFYGWEDACMNAFTHFDKPEVKPSALLTVTEYMINMIGSAVPQVSTALTMAAVLDKPGSVTSYSDVMLMLGSIESLSEFVGNISMFHSTWKNFKTSMRFFERIFSRNGHAYVKHSRQIPNNGAAVKLEDCTFSWGDDGKFALKPISLTIKAGDFVTIFGRIGSGKSSFLSGLCGHMPIIGGQGFVNGRIGYVAQKPYIMGDTLRENILMGADYNKDLFRKVIEACALAEDIRQLPAQDMTMVGPNGINLSGGQIVRLALARALYLQADVYILDDILSAVDSQVERHIIEHVLASTSIIGKKTRILVTHAENLMSLSNMTITFSNSGIVVARNDPTPFIPKSATSSPDTTTSGIAAIQPASVTAANTVCDPDTDSTCTSTSESTFTIHPELDQPHLTFAYLLKYLQLCGIGAVACVFAVYLLNASTIHLTEVLHMRLMVDDNPDTISSSLKQYLFVSVALAIGGQQLNLLEDWIRNRLWSKVVIEKMRQRVIRSVVMLPLPLVERLSRSTLGQIFFNDRRIIGRVLPQVLCDSILGSALSAASVMIQIYKAFPGAFLLVIPLTAATSSVKTHHARLIEDMIKLSHMVTDSSIQVSNTILYNRSLLRIHEIGHRYLRKQATHSAISLGFKLAWINVASFHSLMSDICKELVRSSILGYVIWRCLWNGASIVPGEVDVFTFLTLNAFSRLTALSSIDGVLDDYIRALSRHFVYTEKLEHEGPRVIKEKMPSEEWPQTGSIEFHDYYMRYLPGLDLVLKGVTFSVSENEKIGIVGRTGAGKSSLTYALMRMVEPAGGYIKIDGVDISTIGTHSLRSCIAVIPQDPALFQGTIRENLDPYRHYTDNQVWAAIRAAQMTDILDTPTRKYVPPPDDDDEDIDRIQYGDDGPWVEGIGLNKWIDYDGVNLSVGQRQLVSLCRALLWRRKIVVLDEATANIDSKTDRIMQTVIREKFKDRTVLTIAHRLNTVLDSDRILVVDAGKVVEFDTPENLLVNKDGYFAKLVESMKLQ